MLTRSEVDLIQDSFALISKDKDALAQRFYQRLFAAAPKTRMIFTGDMERQRNMLISVMAIILKGLEDPENLQPYLAMLGGDHARMGVRADYYKVFSEVFIETVVDTVGKQPDGRLEAAWRNAFGLINPVMKMATIASGADVQRIRA